MVEAESVKGASEAASSDAEANKQAARSMLEAGSTIEEIGAATGLGRNQILGLKGSMAKANKKALEKTEVEPSGLGKANDEEKNLIEDFKGENALAASAVILARNKSRLKLQDPALYNSLFPSGQQPESNTSRLADLEIARYIKSMRLEEEAGHSNNGDSQAMSGLQKQINDLREELHKKDVEALQKQSDKLQEEVRELRTDLRSSAGSNSDLAVVFRESKDLLEKVITHDGVLRSYLLPDNLSLRPPGTAPPLHAQVEPGTGTVVSELRGRGLVTRIIQKGGS